MSPERIKQLKGLDFIWVVGKGRGEAKAKMDADKWDNHFRLLQEYQRDNGNCDVPQRYEVGDVKLGNWVNRQRKQYQLQKMSPEQIQQLDGLGFTWKSKRGGEKKC